MRAIGRQLDQVGAAIFTRQEAPYIRPFVIGVVFSDYPFILIASLDFGQLLYGTHAVDCDLRSQRGIEDFMVQRALNVDARRA